MGDGSPDTAGTPRWAKALAIVLLVVALVVLVVRITGIGGEHGPGRHASGPASVFTPHVGEA
jgi:hypothetical protein